jgi:hypothetical protein
MINRYIIIGGRVSASLSREVSIAYLSILVSVCVSFMVDT